MKVNSGMKKLLLIVIAVIPWRLKRFLLRHWFGYIVSEDSFIGISVIDVGHLELRGGAKIGHFNYFRSVGRVVLGENALIGNLNWFTGGKSGLRRADGAGARSSLEVGAESSITNRHYFDCTDSIRVGDFTTVAGVRSTFLSHSINFKCNRQVAAPIDIGSYDFVGSGVVMLPGASVPDKTLLAAGAVVTKPLTSGAGVYGGVPAKLIGTYDHDAGYFCRSRGVVE